MPGCANSDSVATGVVYLFNDGSLGNPSYDRATASSTYLETFEAANARLEVTRRAERFDVGYSGAPQLKPHLTGSVAFDQGQMTRVNRGRRQEVSVAAHYAGSEWNVDLLKSGNDAFFESGLIDSHFLYISGSYGSEGFLIRYDLKSHSEKRPYLGSPIEAD